MDWIKKYRWPLLFITATLVRLILLFWDFSFDVNNHLVWGQDATTHSLRGFYETPSTAVFATRYPNYPPLAIYLFALLSFLYQGIHSLFWFLNLKFPLFPSGLMFFIETRNFQAGIFKIPSIIGDFFLAWAILLLARRFIPKNKKFVFSLIALVLLNPLVFYLSAFWGQIDVLPLTLALFALYFLLYTQKSTIGFLLYTLSLLVKPTTLIFLPVFLYLLWKRFGWQKFILAGIVSNLIFWLLFLPFYREGNFWLFPYQTFVYKILQTQSIQFVNNSAINFWLILPGVYKLPDLTPDLFNLPFRFWGYVLTIIVVTYTLLKQRLKKLDLQMISTFFVLSFASFLFLTRMHERYVFLIWPFILLLWLKFPRLKTVFLIFSLVAFFNIYKSFAVPRVSLLVWLYEQQLTLAILAIVNMGVYWIIARAITSQPGK